MHAECVASILAQVILRVLRRALHEEDPLLAVGRMLDIVHSALAHEVPRRRACGQPLASEAGGGGEGLKSQLQVEFPSRTMRASESFFSPGSASVRVGASELASDDNVRDSAEATRSGVCSTPCAEVICGQASDVADGSRLQAASVAIDVPEPRSGAPSSQQITAFVLQPVVAELSRLCNARCPRRRYLIGAFAELLYSQQQHALPPDEVCFFSGGRCFPHTLSFATQGAASLLLGLLAEQESFFQLHQYVQYQVVADSHATAVQLLQLVPEYAPALELALDMLQRLGSSANEIVLRELLDQVE